MQSILSLIYPSQCMGCGMLVESEPALCPECWRDTPFIRGSVCVKCGAPLLGEAPGDEEAECDDCMLTARPWVTGTSVIVYQKAARRLVLGLKHGDRHDLAKPLAAWMTARLRVDLGPDDLVVPVPIHWRRMLKRRFNQSALLAKEIAGHTGARFLPDALIRLKHTAPQEGLRFDERFELQAGTIRAHRRRAQHLLGRRVLVVDDVMTSGATLATACGALRDAGAGEIHTVTLARVVKEI